MVFVSYVKEFAGLVPHGHVYFIPLLDDILYKYHGQVAYKIQFAGSVKKPNR